MAINPNMKLIQAQTSTSSSITFSAIPQTYTDLKLVISSRTSYATTSSLLFRPNGSTSNLTARRIYGTGSSPLTDTGTNALQNGQDTTSATFTNIEVYFPNYTSSNYKSFSLDGVMENNATFAYTYYLAYLWSDTAAISSLELVADGNFVSGSTFYLYGITSASASVKATGGQIMQDADYFYHVFASSGVFTPSTNLTCDYLVIAGGGAGGTIAGNQVTGAGGGAGGLRSTVGATGGGGSLESALSLTSGTGYTVTIGGGGAIGTWPTRGSSGSNSVFSTITSAGGGAGGIYASSLQNGVNGGSGGGGSHVSGTGGSPSPSGQGYAGGNGSSTNANGSSGGGGGAGAIGSNATVGIGQAGGAGGNGVAISAYANATATGVNTYYAGGGGGGTTAGFAPASGGLGGGGNGAVSNIAGVTGSANTGGGGGGGQYAQLTAYNPGTGGSGLVIVRYAK
jgi:hypothetical protein